MAATISIEDFAEEARSFLDANAERRPPAKEFVWGEGSDDVGMFDEKRPEVEARERGGGQGVAAEAFDAGFGWITGPGASTAAATLAPALRAGVPRASSRSYAPRAWASFTIGLGMVAPTILAHAVPEVQGALPARPLPWRHRRLPAVLRAGGRDRTSPASRPERCATATSGCVSGQKVWTSARAPSPTSARSSAGPIPTSPSTRG